LDDKEKEHPKNVIMAHYMIILQEKKPKWRDFDRFLQRKCVGIPFECR